MNTLSPSILSCDMAKIGDQILEAVNSGATYIHIDVMDGMFVPALSYGQCVVKSLRKITNAVFDVHLMVTEPIRYVKEFAEIGADIITVHLEACEDVDATLDAIKACGKKAGLSIKPATLVSEIEKYLPKVSMVLVMTVEPGFGGQHIIPESFDRIREARELITKSGLDIDLEVDGGINRENLDAIIKAGANVIVAGNAVFVGDIRQNVGKLLEIMN